MSEKKLVNIHVEIYGYEMLNEVISRARHNCIPYDKEMKYDFCAHGHTYLVFQGNQLTLVEDPVPHHLMEVCLNDLFEMYLERVDSHGDIKSSVKYTVTPVITIGFLNT